MSSDGFWWDNSEARERNQAAEQDHLEQGSRVAYWFQFEDDPAELDYLGDS